MRKIRATTGFNVILNEMIAGGLPRPDGMPGCMIAIRPGVNVVPDELLEHFYLKSHIDSGSVTLCDVDEPPRAISKFLREHLHNPFTETDKPERENA
jgi:hypothetical protein